jgi:hypothetical protein
VKRRNRTCCLLQCMSQVLALMRRLAMSALSPLLEHERTLAKKRYEDALHKEFFGFLDEAVPELTRSSRNSTPRLLRGKAEIGRKDEGQLTRSPGPRHLPPADRCLPAKCARHRRLIVADPIS